MLRKQKPIESPEPASRSLGKGLLVVVLSVLVSGCPGGFGGQVDVFPLAGEQSSNVSRDEMRGYESWENVPEPYTKVARLRITTEKEDITFEKMTEEAFRRAKELGANAVVYGPHQSLPGDAGTRTIRYTEPAASGDVIREEEVPVGDIRRLFIAWAIYVEHAP